MSVRLFIEIVALHSKRTKNYGVDHLIVTQLQCIILSLVSIFRLWNPRIIIAVYIIGIYMLRCASSSISLHDR